MVDILSSNYDYKVQINYVITNEISAVIHLNFCHHYSRNWPYMPFLNIPQLGRQGADLQTKIEELQIIHQPLERMTKKMHWLIYMIN